MVSELHTKNASDAREALIWEHLADLPDPEIPVLTLMDLGVIRSVRTVGDAVTVGVAPTYTGCPATEVIESSVLQRLTDRGYEKPSVERVLSPPWTTDWISDEGRDKLRAYGIAPPSTAQASKRSLFKSADATVACPRCDSAHTTKVSEFGSTPCKASYKCERCLEPFEYFKCL